MNPVALNQRTWRIVSILTGIYSLSRINLGLQYVFLPNISIPEALQKWPTPLWFWGIVWAAMGLIGIITSISQFKHLPRASMWGLAGMNVIWAIIYWISSFDGSPNDRVAASTYGGAWALLAALAVLIAVERRRA